MRERQKEQQQDPSLQRYGAQTNKAETKKTNNAKRKGERTWTMKRKE